VPVEGNAGEIDMVGKYLCVVSHMAGIQYENDGVTRSGNIRPYSEKFFVNIRPYKLLMDKCPFDLNMTHLYWLGCQAKYEAIIDNNPPMRGDDQHLFHGVMAIDFFEMSDDFTFTRFAGILSSSGMIVSDGKCTKL
jgi:hypothetical protein